jgi:flagellar biosynthesis protein FlhB
VRVDKSTSGTKCRKKYLRDIALIIRADLFTGVKITGSIIWDIIIKTSMVFIIIAAADFFYQRKRYIKDNMMSKHDIKQEYKQSEGDPQQKADRKRSEKLRVRIEIRT